jgi:hypothetical protein
MPPFDLADTIRMARAAPARDGWQIVPLRTGAARWDLLVRLGMGLVLLAVGVVLAVTAHVQVNGAVPYLFAAFALLASAAYLGAAWTPWQQLQHPERYLLVVAPDGVALAWAGDARGLALGDIGNAALRRRSFRAIFGHDLALTRVDGSEVSLPVGELFGDPNELLTLVIERTRGARGH